MDRSRYRVYTDSRKQYEVDAVKFRAWELGIIEQLQHEEAELTRADVFHSPEYDAQEHAIDLEMRNPERAE